MLQPAFRCGACRSSARYWRARKMLRPDFLDARARKPEGGNTMRRFVQRGAAARTLLYVIVVIVLGFAVVALWLALGPGPLDFAGGKRGALSSGSGPG